MAMSFLFSLHYLEINVVIGAVSDFFFFYYYFFIIVLADSSPLQRRPWQSSFQRLQELLSIGSRCLGWRYLFIFLCKRNIFLGNHFLVYSSNNDIAYFFTPEPELTKQFFNSLVSLVRIRLGSLPFPKVAMEWQLELAVL